MRTPILQAAPDSVCSQKHKPALYYWFRLTKPTVGFVCGSAEDREYVTLPEDTVIRVPHEIRDGDRLIAVKWQEQLVMLFEHDLRRNSTPTDPSGGLALGAA
jgi:hypothetical protein